MKVLSASLLLPLLLCTPSTIFAQQYDDDYQEYQDYGGDYGQDTLYHDYAERQENKGVGNTGGAGIGKLIVTGAATWLLGAKYHSGKVAKKLKRKHQGEQKKLYSQYYNDVYKLSEQNKQLQRQVEELTDLVKSTEAKAELEALQRDYDEFKQPDIDGDDRISRAEFNMYVKDYLSSYPGLSEADYPKFEDFDHDGDGFVSFQEYSQQMALQAQQAELEQMYSAEKQQKAQALNDMYKSATGGGGGLYH
ncbi:unnamed protein product [Cylindrotheca closterium]|uniref:EF-hand domain-containing protein n=1 Tax=Cylindrotheca closterium TaxID=2856 RepID=A0AAD2JJX2_9STRA|nr:unnamed protein product [Cylindrotheca closterium]